MAGVTGVDWKRQYLPGRRYQRRLGRHTRPHGPPVRSPANPSGAPGKKLLGEPRAGRYTYIAGRLISMRARPLSHLALSSLGNPFPVKIAVSGVTTGRRKGTCNKCTKGHVVIQPVQGLPALEAAWEHLQQRSSMACATVQTLEDPVGSIACNQSMNRCYNQPLLSYECMDLTVSSDGLF